jgi:hypothetical protein
MVWCSKLKYLFCRSLISIHYTHEVNLAKIVCVAPSAKIAALAVALPLELG